MRAPITRFRGVFILVGAACAATLPLGAADWVGSGSASWNTVGSPGWETAVPNGVGAVANLSQSTAGTTAQDLAGLTLGTLSLTNDTANIGWAITVSQDITLNQDGAGSGAATIANNNTFGTSANSLSLVAGGGSLVLADNLSLISTSTTSSNSTGAIRIAVPITGTGNITVSNAQTQSAAIAANRTIALTGANTFEGNILIQKGTLYTNNTSGLGAATNTVTLGETGQGNAMLLLASSSTATYPQPIVAAAGTTGTSTLFLSAGGDQTLSGGVTLNGNLTVSKAGAPARATISGVISGPGMLTKAGASSLALTAVNTYQGGTTILPSNTIRLIGNGTLGSGPVTMSGQLFISEIAGSSYAMANTFTGWGTTLLETKSLELQGLVTPGDPDSNTALNFMGNGSGGTSGALRFTNTTSFAYSLLGRTYITLTLGANLDLGAGVIEFSDFNFTTGGSFGAGQHTLMSVTGGGTLTGTLGSSLTGLIGTGYEGTLAVDGNNLVLNVTAIPEPSTWAALTGMAALGLALRRKAGRRKMAATN